MDKHSAGACFGMGLLVAVLALAFLCSCANTTENATISPVYSILETSSAAQNTPSGDLKSLPVVSSQPIELTDKEKLDIESEIQIARQAGSFDSVSEISGQTLYSLLDYIYNDELLHPTDQPYAAERYIGDYTEGLTEEGAQKALDMVLGSKINFEKCKEYASTLSFDFSDYKDGKIFKGYEDGKFAISPHDPQGGGGEPFYSEHVLGATYLEGDKYSITTDVHQITYDETGSGKSEDKIVGHSTYIVSRDSSSVFGSIVVSANPDK